MMPFITDWPVGNTDNVVCLVCLCLQATFNMGIFIPAIPGIQVINEAFHIVHNLM